MTGFDDIFENKVPVAEPQEEAPFDKDAWGAQKQAERKAVYERADTVAHEIVSSGHSFQEYLDVQTRFSHYSVTNAMLILAQKPLATRLKDFDGWKAEGVSIKRNQTAISILEPGPEYKRNDGNIGTSYNVKKVFDVSQTTARGKQKTAPKVDDRTLLTALIRYSPASIQMVDELPGNAGAVYNYEQQTISVRRGMDAPDLFRSFSYALARAELDDSGRITDPDKAAFPAYCVSYMLCRQNGVDVSGYSFEQLPEGLVGGEAQEIREALTQIRDTAHEISGKMSRVLEQAKTAKSREQER